MGDQPEKAIGDIIKAEIGDNAKGVAVGKNITQWQNWNEVAGRFDLRELAEQLGSLRLELLKEAQTPEQYIAIGAVASAETEAKQANGPKALEYLSKTGTWVLDVATKIGITVAAAAIKESIGIK
jgi:hypothetical protein